MTVVPPPTEPPAPSAKELELQGKLAQMQADLDAAKKLGSRRQPAPAPVPATLTPAEQLQAFANEKAREVEVLRTAALYGLTEDELLDGGTEFSNPTELRLTAQLKAQEKKQKALDDTLTEQKQILEALKKKGAEDEPDERSDAGGRTRRVAREAKAAELRTEALKKGRTTDGRYTLLESIKNDPTKRMQPSRFDDE